MKTTLFTSIPEMFEKTKRKFTTYPLVLIAICIYFLPLLWQDSNNILFAQPTFTWAKKMGGVGSDIGWAIAVDAGGNVYTTGYYRLTVDFDPGAGVCNLTAAGFDDVFISKLDPLGNFVWAKSMGGAGQDIVFDIAVDPGGNVYTTGWFEGTSDFDPGAGVSNMTSAGGHDIFISKLDPSGNFMWARSMGGALTDNSLGIAVDAGGNIFTTGQFQGTADFDPAAAGVFNLISAGAEDIFVSKLDASGNFSWAKQMGGASGAEIGCKITLDASGNVFTTGAFVNIADFDPGAGTNNLTAVAGSSDVFVSKLDPSGNFIWAKSMGGINDETGRDIVVDNSGNVHTTGSFFSPSVDFDPGAAAFNLNSAGGYDIFISKLDASGDFLWAKTMGGIGFDGGHSIALDASGNVFTTGQFKNTVDFDPGAGTYNLISAGGDDAFVNELDASGNFVCAGQMGGPGLGSFGEFGSSMVVDAGGSIYTTGGFVGMTDFDPGAAMFNLTSAGGSDVFVSKLQVCNSVLNVTATPTNILCNGQCTGIAAAAAAGGTSPYTYLWNPTTAATATATATGLCAGTYTVTITDAANNTSTATATITQPAALTTTITSTPTTCGANDGTASVTANGGIPGYTYLWAPGGATSSSVTGLSASNYMVTITDANGCSKTTTTNISNSNGPNISLLSQVNILCKGQCTGSAAVAAAGGSAPYTYLWNPTAAATATATGLCAGNYVVTVIDSLGCSSMQTATITGPAAITTTLTSTQASCNINNGSATVSAAGGTGTFTYSWTSSIQTTATATGLGSGNYTCTITDANGCTQINTVTVTNSNGPNVSLLSQVNILCKGQCTGSASVAAAGGSGAYTYLWNPTAAATAAATGLCAGNYVVTVTDALGCSSTQTVSLTEPTAMIATATSVPACGLANGTATVTVSGGVPLYSYSWLPAGNGPIASGLSTGSYTAIVTDANGCTQSSVVGVITNTNPTAVAFSNVTITSGSSTILSASGGNTYLWSNSATTTVITVSPVATTTYCVTVADANNCTDTGCVIVVVEPTECPPAKELYLPNAFSPNNDGGNDVLKIYYGNISCIKEYQITIYNRWGEKVFFAQGNPGLSGEGFFWDGMYKGKMINSSVCVYYLQATLISGETITKKGNVSLLR